MDGVSLSPSIVIGYMMQVLECTMEECLHFVRDKRAVVEPNPSFMKQLQFMSTPFYKILNSTCSMKEKYDWYQDASKGDILLVQSSFLQLILSIFFADFSEKDVSLLYAEEKRAHKQAQQRVHQLEVELDKTKQSLQRLVTSVSNYMSVSDKERHSLSEKLQDQSDKEKVTFFLNFILFFIKITKLLVGIC